MKEAPFAREEIAHITRNLRSRDQAELYALRWHSNPDELVNEILIYAHAMWRMFCVDAEPAAMAGVIPTRPGVVSAAAFGTESVAVGGAADHPFRAPLVDPAFAQS